jgi:hypothetical protein
MMDAKTHFPFSRLIGRALTGRRARRTYVVVLFLLFLVTTSAWLRVYIMTRKIQAVLHGLAETRLDQTTEEQLMNMVPYLTQEDWRVDGIPHRRFSVRISNEEDWPIYGFVHFDASVLVQDGRVSHAEYGLANRWVRPLYAGYVGYIVSARSVHGFWLPGPLGLEVTSVDDDSPQYRPRRYGNNLSVIYTSDAPPELTRRLFDLNLSCFWGLRGCDDGNDITPNVWRDTQTIPEASYQQLISEKCPNSIIEGRMRYLPDISVLLLEVIGSRRVEVNEEGRRTEDWFTDYELKEVIRGQSLGSWKSVRFQRTIPSPMDPTRQIANQIWPPTKVGSQVLFFGGLGFDSCRFIPATPSAIEVVRKTPVPPKRSEDRIPRGLM